jgi:hypothetical protein
MLCSDKITIDPFIMRMQFYVSLALLLAIGH